MTSKVLFKYIEGTDKIEYGDFTVRTGIDTVQVLPSSGEILHNGSPIGGGSSGSPSTPFLIDANVVKCNIGVFGHPEENSQTIRVPLAPFIIDAGGGAPFAAGVLRLLTIEVVDTAEFDLIFPNFTFSYSNAPPTAFSVFIADNNTQISGTSLGRKEVDPITGKNLWRVLLNIGNVAEIYGYDTLLSGVTFDTCSKTIESIPTP